MVEVVVNFRGVCGAGKRCQELETARLAGARRNPVIDGVYSSGQSRPGVGTLNLLIDNQTDLVQVLEPIRFVGKNDRNRLIEACELLP
jgi:hypothetical protein